MKRAIESDFPFELINEIAEVESYRKEINRPIYHIHKWWAKRLGSVFRSIISGSLSVGEWIDFYQEQNFSGKVVLDPFMGSGTTLGEAIKLGASVIGCDVNPVSTFMVKQGLQHVDINLLQDEFNRIENDVKANIQSYYLTKVNGSKQPTPALYYFWVKIIETPEGEEIPLFSNYVFSKNAYPKKKPMAQIWCPHCESVITGPYNSTLEVCSVCNNEFNPQNGPVKGAKVYNSKGKHFKIKELVNKQSTPPKHKLYAIMALNEDGEKVYIKPSQFDHELLVKAKKQLNILENGLPLPKQKVRSGHNTNQAKGYNYHHWIDFFNDRQLLCLGILLKRILKIKDRVIRDHFVCLFSGILEFNNLFCSFKGEGTGAVRHMFSHHILKPERTPLENTVWGVNGKSSGTFSSLFKSRLIKAKSYLDEPFELYFEKNNGKRVSKKIICSKPIHTNILNHWNDYDHDKCNALILNGDSSSLPIPDKSVDVVVTDPPYFDFIHYSELSDFFYAWISEAIGRDYDFLRKNDSSHKNEVQDKDDVKFSKKIGKIFKECKRVLKDDGLLCFSYHHSTIPGWIAIYNAVTSSGFDIVAAHPVKAEMSVASPKSATKEPINLDAILVCKQRQNNNHKKTISGDLDTRVNNYIRRFQCVDRILSKGDKFVITCAQGLSIASCHGMDEQEAIEYLTESTSGIYNKDNG